MAVSPRHPDATLGPHADRGVPEAATASRTVRDDRGITLSMSRNGHGSDKAPMESANGTINTERVDAPRSATRAEAKADLIEYLGYDHTDRRHSALASQRPVACARQWWSQRHPTNGSLTTNQGDASVWIRRRSPVISQI